ncbi:MAG: type I-C CRISPR-associated endonuclease Cas1 [Chthonomonadales bacterium]|nr:type I-C CRISPR-associated endonuclease Cas1 [Chthonomonadales bacterium]
MSRELLNTLFVLTPGAYARLDGDTVRVEAQGERLLQAPLLHLGSLVFFGGATPSAPLMERCARDGRGITFLDGAGRFQARVVGPTGGNVLLRTAQYEAGADAGRCADVARAMVAAKLRNGRSLLLRGARDCRSEEGREALREACSSMAVLLTALPGADSLEVVRGVEGQAAALYFAVLGHVISRPPAEFAFRARTRRPPRDRVNALLSFLYAILTSDCVGAAEGVGLDPQVGFLHAIRPGRPSLALDLMEEFRAPLVDRVVLGLINRRQVRPEHFEERPGGSVMMTDDGRRLVLRAYQEHKQEEVVHPFLKERAPVGLLPHLQARLLARHLRGDLPSYLPYVARQ